MTKMSRLVESLMTAFLTYVILANIVWRGVLANPTLKSKEMFGTNWKDVLSKRSSDQPADNQQEAGSIILNKREIKQIDYHPAREQKVGEAIEREKRRQHAATGDISVESSEVGGRIEKQQKLKSKRKKINKNGLNNGENEDSLTLSKHQLEQIYRFLKNKNLFESLNDHDSTDASLLPDRLIELLASRTAYDLALKWFVKLPSSSLSSSKLNPSLYSMTFNQDQHLESIFLPIYSFLYSVLKSAQSKLKLARVTNAKTDSGHFNSNNLENENKQASYLNRLNDLVLNEGTGLSDNDFLEKYLEAFVYTHFGISKMKNFERPPQYKTDEFLVPHRLASVIRHGDPYATASSQQPFAYFPKLNDIKTNVLSDENNRKESIRSFHHHFHVYEGPEEAQKSPSTPHLTERLSTYSFSKPYNFGMNVFQNQKSPVVCTNYPEHSSQGFKSFVSVESCTQPSFLSHTGMPVFGHGCTFRFTCDTGFHSATDAAIKCINGYWSSRAICLRNVENEPNRPLETVAKSTGRILTTVMTNQPSVNSNVFHHHQNYIKRFALSSNESFNRKKRSDDESDEKDTDEDNDIDRAEAQSTEVREDDLNAIMELNQDKLVEDKSVYPNSIDSHKQVSVSPNLENILNLSSTKSSDLDESAAESSSRNETSSENDEGDEVEENDYEDTLGDIRQNGRIETTKISSTTSGPSIKKEYDTTQQPDGSSLKWPLEIDNDLEKSIYESFQELVDDRK